MATELSNATTPLANVTTSSPAPSSWLFDIVASNHVTYDQKTLHSVSEYGEPDKIVLGDGTCLPIIHVGHTHTQTLKPRHKRITLKVVLYVLK